jgi:hypothetical protein
VPELRLGPFPVRTERTQIEAYRSATRTTGEEVPTAFPICWLGQPQIRGAVAQACRERLPLHEGQTFEYVRPLEQHADYRLSLTLSEEADPARLVLKSECRSPGGELCLRMETLLRLVAPAVLELSA